MYVKVSSATLLLGLIIYKIDLYIQVQYNCTTFLYTSILLQLSRKMNIFVLLILLSNFIITLNGNSLEDIVQELLQRE